MRGVLYISLLAASLAFAADGFEEQRELVLLADGMDRLVIEAGAGSLEVRGNPGADSIRVTATVRMDGVDADEGQKRLEDLELSLEADGRDARLVSNFDSGFFGGHGARVDLVVDVPARLSLDVDDGSGSIDVNGIEGATRIVDGSGSITISAAGGDIAIDDGSGSIDIRDAAGNVDLEDGSGSIDVRGVRGSVMIDDGSGGIVVSNVDGDLTIPEAGSGGVRFTDVRGRVDYDDS